MYNKETQQREHFDESNYTKDCFYPDTIRQLAVIKSNFDRTQKSCFLMREVMKKIYQQETVGFIQANLILNSKSRNRIEQLFALDYLAYITIKVEFFVDEPLVAGQFYRSSEGGYFFSKCNKMSYARALFPCLDFIDDYYKVSKLRVVTDYKGSQVISMGKLVAHEVVGNREVWDFDINKVINVSYLPLMVGKFETVPLMLGARKVNIICQTKNLAFRVHTTERDHIEFLNRLYEFDLQKLRLKNSMIEEYQWLYLDSDDYYPLEETTNNRFVYRGDCSFFYKTVVLDSGIVIDKKSVETHLFNECEAVLRYSYTLHLERIAPKSHNDYWIFTGSAQFAADMFLMVHSTDELFTQYVFEKKRRAYLEMVTQGKDVNPLNVPHFSHPSESCFDQCYNLKSCLVFHLMFSSLKLTKHRVSELTPMFLGEEYYDENRKPHPMSYTETKKVFKKIRHDFGTVNLRANLEQFLQNTGTAELNCDYTHNRKDNRIKITIRQTPLQLQFYKTVMEERFKLESEIKRSSPIQEILRMFETSLCNLQTDSQGLISTDSVQAFLNDDGRIIMNACHASLKYLKGKFDVLVTETNDIELNEERHDIKIEDKAEQQLSFDLRTKFRRIVPKKGGEIDASGIAVDGGGYYTSGPGGYGAVERGDNVMIGGAPYLWFKIDPENHYLHRINIRDGENIYIAQLEKELKDQTDLSNAYRILESLTHCANSSTQNRLTSHVHSKDIDQLIKIEMVNTLMAVVTTPQLSNGQINNLCTEKNANKILDLIINLIKKLKFESDQSLKPNDFSHDYLLLNHLIQEVTIFERKIQKQTHSKETNNGTLKEMAQTDEVIIDILLSLLQKNDNSQNHYDDTFYQANILRSLFRCVNKVNFNLILTEVDRFLNIEYYTHYDYKYLIDTIFSELITFIANHYDSLGISLANGSMSDVSFYENSNLKRFPQLSKCLKPFKQLSEKHRFDPILCRSVFLLNFTIKKRIEKLKPWELLLWGLKYVEETRKLTSSFICNKILEALLENLEKIRPDLRKMQTDLNVQNARKISGLLFEICTSPYAFLDIYYRYLTLGVYRLMYDDFVPVCEMVMGQEDKFIFPLDPNWLNFKFEMNLENANAAEKKIFTLNLLSMHNRKKTISGQIAPSQGSAQYNLRDLLFQNFKFNKESPTWRNLSKQIISVLMSEKTTSDIENKFLDDNDQEASEAPGNSTDLVLRIKTSVSLKDLKRKLMKPCQQINSIDQFKEELFKVIDFYLTKDYIGREVYDEYNQFARALIAEVESYLKEKAQKEEEKLRKMKRLRATGGHHHHHH